MKKKNQKKFLRNFALIAGILFITFSISSCSRKMTFGKSVIVPAAEGSVKIKTDKNKNYTIDINVKHLARPDQLTPPKKTYVVWMETEGNGTKNIGNINSSTGLLSSTLKGSLKTVTSFKPTGFFITAEDDASIRYPGTETVLSTR